MSDKKTAPSQAMQMTQEERDRQKLAQENNTVETYQMWKNLEFIRENTGSQMTKSKYVTECLQISINGYDNYKNAKIPVNRIRCLDVIVENVDNLVKSDAKLSKWFPKGILKGDLLRGDLSKLAHSDAPAPFYIEKFYSTYLCYYTSTKSGGENSERTYGVLRITKTHVEKDCVMEADGVFAIKSPEEALALYRKSVSAPGEALSALTSAPVFKGRATVQREMLRFYLEQDDSLEFVSFSCDLNPKILEKNPSKLFRGGLGIAHSQTTGSTAKGIGFPFAISRAPITVSDGVLAKYLCFRNSLSPGFSGETLATNFLSLNSSISELIGAEELRTKLLAKLIESEFSTLLERTVTNAHVITEAQQNQFYHEVLVPSFPING